MMRSRVVWILGLAVTFASTAPDALAVTCLRHLAQDASMPPTDKWSADLDKLLGKVPSIDRDDRPMDVLAYDIDLTVAVDRPDIDGNVVIEFEPTQGPISQATFDLLNAGLAVSEVRVGPVPGAATTFTHQDNVLVIDLPAPVAAGTLVTVQIFYSGEPQRGPGENGTGFGLIGFAVGRFAGSDFNPDPQRPVVYTLSEPDGARSWWPCHDTPYDAAAVELSITAPDDMILAAPGVKTEETPTDPGMWRQTYSMPTPIPPYLVSIALAKYNAAWQEAATVHVFDPAVTDGNYDTVQIPVQMYVDDLRESRARFAWQNIVEMIETYETLFGPYPYSDLDPGPAVLPGKYGMAMFLSGYAMEHPTMSSMGTGTFSSVVSDYTGGPADEWVAAHELTHQWFGDAVRVERWGEIWLNEGFATYGEFLWLEAKYGYATAKRWFLERRTSTSYQGPLLDPAPNQVFGVTVYHKGAWVLHMLRQVLGRDGLLTAMRNYVENPQLRHARAVSTADFQTECEQVLRDQGNTEALVGDSLDWFFGPWLEREGRPALTARWGNAVDGEQPVLRLSVVQPTGRTYRLPLPLRLLLSNGSGVNEVVWVDGEETIVDVPVAATVVQLDVDPSQDWLLDVDLASGLPGDADFAAPFPNPFVAGKTESSNLTVPFLLRSAQNVKVEVFDLRGRRVREVANDEFPAGNGSVSYDFRDEDGEKLASGTYFVRVRTADGGESVRPVTLLK
jgi:aminopeptidase N